MRFTVVALCVTTLAAGVLAQAPVKQEFDVTSVKRHTSGDPHSATTFVAVSTASLTLSVLAQAPSEPAWVAKAASLEVASIKVSAENRGGALSMQPGGRLIAQNIRVRDMVNMAFQSTPALMSEQIVGLPDWASVLRFNIEAKFIVQDAASASAQTNSGAYIRAILNGRFGFQAHLEKRELPVLVLSVAPGGLKLKSVDIDCGTQENKETCTTKYAAGQATSRAMLFENLASQIMFAAQLPIFDETGLNGRFDVDLQWNPDSLANTDDPRPTIFGAVQGMGLRLDRSRKVIDVLVIDRVERPTVD